jgi:hypothetical protein
MKFAILVAGTLLLAGCSGAGGFRVTINPMEASPSDSISLGQLGIVIQARWTDKEHPPSQVMLFDGVGNPVWNADFRGMSDWSQLITTDTIVSHWEYAFTGNDKAGVWTFVLRSEGLKDDSVRFFVAEAGKSPIELAEVDCFRESGEINLANFYQLTAEQVGWMSNPVDAPLIPVLRWELQRRAARCLAPEFSYESIEEFDRWFGKISGHPVRNPNPAVEERVKTAMPAFEREFLFVNPEFVAWFAGNMIPDPSQSQMNGRLYAEIYQSLIQTRLRNLALVGLYYLSLPNGGADARVSYAEYASRFYYDQQQEQVREREGYVYLAGYLERQYAEACNDWIRANLPEDEYGNKPIPFNTMDMGFWLRRGIDGSANELWLALREVLQKYDRGWYDRYIDPYWAP